MINNWRNIHLGFISELQQKWEAEGFTYEQVKEWINIGLKPTDYKFATYLRYTLGHKPEEVLNFADLPTLRTIYQESLNEQFENLQIQPTIREPRINEDEPLPEIPILPQELELVKALSLSLELPDGGDSDSSSTEEEEEEISKELKKYLLEKRLDLKRYFVFSIQELTTEKICDDFKRIAYNGRTVKETLTEDLTKLAVAHGWNKEKLEELHQKEVKKKFLILTKVNGLSPSEQESQTLDRKITEGWKSYIVFPKNDNWVDWKGQMGNIIESDAVVIRVKPSLYLRNKKEVLKFLKENDPALSGKKNLYEWWKEEKKIEEMEKERLVKIGIKDKKESSNEYKVEELKRILKYEDIAKQNKDKFSLDENQIKKIILFSPPRFQDKDCAIIISERKTIASLPALGSLTIIPSMMPFANFDVLLLVYEAPWKNIGNNLYVKQVKSCFILEDAEKEADKLIKELMDKNNPYPACAVFDKVGDVFEPSFPNWSTIGGTSGFVSPLNAKHNPEGYFKPLDIVRIENVWRDKYNMGLFKKYSHTAVYLGKDKNGEHKAAQMTSEPEHIDKLKGGVYIDDWKKLFDDSSYDLSRYHPFIAYKKPRIIRKHIARAYTSREYNGAYSLLFGTSDYIKGNCQQFANRTVLGLNITNEGTLFKVNQPLRGEIMRTNQHFANLKIVGDSRQFCYSVRKKIKEFVNQADDQTRKMKLKKTGGGKYTARIVNVYPWKWNKPVELRPSENCKIQ